MTETMYEDLLFVVAFLALFDSVSPSSIRDYSYILKKKRAYAMASTISIARTIAYLLSAPLFYFISAYLAEHQLLDNIMSLVVGILFIHLGRVLWTSPASNSLPDYPSSSLQRLMSVSFKTKLYTLPMIIPYIIAIDEIRAADLPIIETGIFILIYLIFYHAPMTIMGIARLISHRINDFIFRALETSAGSMERYYGTVVLIGFGFLLIATSILYTTNLLHVL
jgi:hypothetical protein